MLDRIVNVEVGEAEREAVTTFHETPYGDGTGQRER